MFSGLAEQVAPPVQITTAANSNPNGETVGELLTPNTTSIFQPLKLGLEYEVVPVPATITWSRPVLVICLSESTATMDGIETTSKVHKSQYFVETLHSPAL